MNESWIGTSSEQETNECWIKRFPVRKGNEFTFVQVVDVDWIGGDYAQLHEGGKTHLIREPPTIFEARLDRK
jgi:hypothetical protein